LTLICSIFGLPLFFTVIPLCQGKKKARQGYPTGQESSRPWSKDAKEMA